MLWEILYCENRASHLEVDYFVILFLSDFWSKTASNAPKNSKKIIPVLPQLSHRRDNKYKCRICPESFVCGSYLVRHMAAHPGQKAFKCEFCEYTTDRMLALRQPGISQSTKWVQSELDGGTGPIFCVPTRRFGTNSGRKKIFSER